MRIPRSCRLAALGLAAPLLILGTAAAQDGKLPLGPPTTTPPTNALRGTAATFEPPTVGSEVLTPVPATATDPAPPGTRVERVDLNKGTRKATAPGTSAVPLDVPGANIADSLPAGFLAAEGFITGKLKTPGKDLPGEQIRFSLDPTRTWADASAKATPPPESAKDEVKPIDIVVTRKTKIYTYARTPDGQIVPDASNPYTPTTEAARSAANIRVPLFATTNFTNLKPEQYVAVQYRDNGDLHEATSLAIVVRASEAAAAAGRAPSTAPGNGLPNVRVPRIPATPTTPGGGN